MTTPQATSAPSTTLPTPVTPSAAEHAPVAQGYLHRMVGGHLGIGRTFWEFQVLWPILLSLPAMLVASIVAEGWVSVLLLGPFVVLNLASLLGLWRAANRCSTGGCKVLLTRH